MSAHHTLTYVGARGLAAALNMASLAVFTRLAPTEAYGAYLLILSFALVLYGATCQWPKFSFFALYDEARAGVQAGTVLRLLGIMVGFAALAASIAAAFGLLEPRAAAAIAAAVLGMTAFEGSVEIARTRLEVRAVALSIVLRAVLVLGLGSAALLATGDPVHLLLATALANLLAALPAGLAIAPLLRSAGSVAEAGRLLAYGWPLVLSFGTAALAQTIDRFVIGGSVGVSELGAYGAVADVLRQSFVVFGDGIALSLISLAKHDARTGGMQAARPALEDAARALALVAGFGAVFFLTFDDLVVQVLLGPGYRETALSVIPILVAASILLMIRSYYFGQVIYFAPSSRLDAVASASLLVTIGGLSWLLIPRLGLVGAALAVAIGQGVACLVFVLGAGKRLRMPLPLADLGLIALAALACWAAVAWVEGLGLGQAAGILVKLGLIALAAGATAWRFDVAGIAGLVARLAGRSA